MLTLVRRLNVNLIVAGAFLALPLLLRSGSAPLPAVAVPPPPPTGSRQEEATVALPSPATILPRLLRLYAARSADPPHHGAGRFTREVQSGFREARLFALARPEEVERLTAALARDGATVPEHRDLAVRMLGFLAEAGRAGARSVLLELASGGDGRVGGAALELLGKVDDAGEHRGLYLRKCLEGWPEAFDALAFWSDPAARIILEDMARPDGLRAAGGQERRSDARYALKRLALLEAPDAEAQLAKVVGDPSEDSENTPWAIRAAKRRGGSGLAERLRRRVEAGETRAKAFYDRFGLDFDGEYATRAEITGLNDPAFDDVLVALAAAGGPLSTRQAARLWTHGYGVAPAKRLAELLPALPK